MKRYYAYSFISMKIGVIALVLFLLIVWPWLANGLLEGVHWGIYLAIAVVALIISKVFLCRRK
jgi:hypothetical protein